MVKKVKASAEGVQEINRKREEKDWKKDQNSEALIIVSQEQFRRSIAEKLKIIGDENPIPLAQLDQLIIQEKIFTDNRTIQQYFYPLKSQKINQITINQCLTIIEDENIHTPGITYRNWQRFLKGEEIELNVFQAFCEALEIQNWRDFVVYPPIYQQTATKQTRLLEGLSLFNHKKQVDLLRKQFLNSPAIFLINNPCTYSRTWMLRRLAMKITDYNPRRCESISLDTSARSSQPTNAEGIPGLFYQKNFSKIESILDSNHLIFTHNVDNYDQKDLRNFLEQDWSPLVDHMKRSQQKKYGKIFMFLLASNQQNDWYQTEGITGDLSSKIINLDDTNIYTEAQEDYLQSSVAEVLEEISVRLDQQLSDDSNNIALTLIRQINNAQNKPEKLLKEIYRHFNCRTTNFADTWQKYP